MSKYSTSDRPRCKASFLQASTASSRVPLRRCSTCTKASSDVPSRASFRPPCVTLSTTTSFMGSWTSRSTWFVPPLCPKTRSSISGICFWTPRCRPCTADPATNRTGTWHPRSSTSSASNFWRQKAIQTIRSSSIPSSSSRSPSANPESRECSSSQVRYSTLSKRTSTWSSPAASSASFRLPCTTPASATSTPSRRLRSCCSRPTTRSSWRTS
mmetsp:Transcript_3457/g.9858  ORF Transcript_3457/g.9858 Transcript_3457/m.9858 type:complete len:213 (-) Transcript_3457:6544-7182(-)